MHSQAIITLGLQIGHYITLGLHIGHYIDRLTCIFFNEIASIFESDLIILRCMYSIINNNDDKNKVQYELNDLVNWVIFNGN